MGAAVAIKAPAKMNTRTVDIDSLVPDPDNTRRHNKRNLAAIRGSLERFGQVEPLVIRSSTNVVVGGNGRLEMLRELGYRKVLVTELELDDQTARALSVALNRTGDLATWDETKLTELLAELQEQEFDLAVLGFDPADLAKRFANMRELAVDGLPAAPTTGAPEGSDPRVASDHVRQVQLFMPVSAFDTFQSCVAALMDHYGTSNVTDTVLRALDEAHSAIDG